MLFINILLLSLGVISLFVESEQQMDAIAGAVALPGLFASIFIGARWASRRGSRDGLAEALLVGMGFELAFISVEALHVLTPYDAMFLLRAHWWQHAALPSLCVGVAYLGARVCRETPANSEGAE